MSVPKSKRKPSSYDPADLAQRLYEHVSGLYCKIYKYSQFISYFAFGRCLELSIEILEHVTKGLECNSELKKEYFMRAYDSTNALEVIIEAYFRNVEPMIYRLSNGKVVCVSHDEIMQLDDYVVRLMAQLEKLI